MTISIRTPIREDEEDNVHLELWNACGGSRFSNQNSATTTTTTKMCDPDIPLMAGSEEEPVWTSEEDESEEMESKLSHFAYGEDQYPHGSMKRPDHMAWLYRRSRSIVRLMIDGW